jgi:hypothetical protein
VAQLHSVAHDDVVLSDTLMMLTGCPRSHSEDTCRVSHLQDIGIRKESLSHFGVQNKAGRVNICSLKQSSSN